MKDQGQVKLTSGLVTESDLEFYREKGAICVRNVIDEKTVDVLRAAVTAAIERHLRNEELRGVPRPTAPHFHILRNAYEHDEALRRALFQSKISAVARDLMQSRKVIAFGDSLFDKEAGAKTTTPWHHDVPFWPVRGDQVCTTWIALDHVARANGAMEYIAGSHLWNRMFRPKYPEGAAHTLNPLHRDYEEIPDFDALRNRHEVLYWELEPGDMLVHHGMTIHGAGENTLMNLGRRAYAPRFVGDEAWWDPAFTSEKTPERALVLAKGDPLDRYDAFPLVLDTTR